MFKSTAEAQSYRPDDEEKKRKFEDRIHFEFSEHGYTAQFERDKEMWFKTLQQPQDERIANILRRIFTIIRYGGLMYREDRQSSDWKVWKDTRWAIATVLSHGGRVLVQIPKAGISNTKLVVLGDADRNRTSETLSPPLSAKNVSIDTTEVSTNLSSSKPETSILTDKNSSNEATTATTTATVLNVEEEEVIEANINITTNSEQEATLDDKNGSKLTSKRNSSNSVASWSSEYSENISHSRRESLETKIIFDDSTPVEDAQVQTENTPQKQEIVMDEKEAQDEGQKSTDKSEDTMLSVEEPTIQIEDSPMKQEKSTDEVMPETTQQDIEDVSVSISPQIAEESVTSPNVKEGEDSSLNTETTPSRTLREPIHERKISLKLDLEKLNFHTYSQSGSQSVPTPNVGSATDQSSSESITSPHTIPSNSVPPSSDSVTSSSVTSPTKEHPSRSQTLKPSSKRKTIFSGLFGKRKNSTLSGPISTTNSEEVCPQPTAQLPEPTPPSSKSPKAVITPRTEKKKKGFFRFFTKTEKTEVTEKDFWKWLITGDPQCSDKELLKFISLSTSGDQCMDEKRVVFKRVAGSHGITYKRKKKNKENEHGGLPSSSSTSILENNETVGSPENDYDSEGGGDYEAEEDLETISNLSDEELEFEKCPFGRTKILMEIKPFGLNSKNSKLVGYSTTTQLKKHRHWGMNIPLGGHNNIAQGMYRIPIEANGRHGHIYFNYMAPTSKHNGGLLIGCESSEYGKTGQNGEMHTIGAHSSTISVTHGYKWRNKICSLENISSVGTPDNLDSMFVDLSYTGWEFLMQCEWKDEFVKESPAELIIRDQSGNLFLPPSDPDEEEWF